MTDPDRGNEMYTYDSDGNLTKSVDARGGAGTIYVGYDALDRPIWRNTSNSPTGAYHTYSYDSTSGGNFGIGQLTSESFSGAGLNGSYSYVYDARGRVSQQTVTTPAINGANWRYSAALSEYEARFLNVANRSVGRKVAVWVKRGGKRG